MMTASLTLTLEEVRQLVALERAMDAGEVPYVHLAGCPERVSMTAELMNRFGLAAGQTISGEIFRAILRFKIETIRAEIAWRDAQPLIREVLEESR